MSWNASARKRRTAQNGPDGRKTDRNTPAYLRSPSRRFDATRDSTTDPAALPTTGHQATDPAALDSFPASGCLPRHRHPIRAGNPTKGPPDHQTRTTCTGTPTPDPGPGSDTRRGNPGPMDPDPGPATRDTTTRHSDTALRLYDLPILLLDFRQISQHQNLTTLARESKERDAIRGPGPTTSADTRTGTRNRSRLQTTTQVRAPMRRPSNDVALSYKRQGRTAGHWQRHQTRPGSEIQTAREAA